VIHLSTDFAFKINKKLAIFTGDLSFSNFKKNFRKRPCFPKIGLFLRATCSFQISKRISTSIHASLKLVYFHGRPAILKLKN
jgi:hypothetical protein